MSKPTLKEITEAFLSEDGVSDKDTNDPDAPSFEELQEKLRTGEVKVVFAQSLHVDDLAEEVDLVIDALGFDSAFVSDLSTISMMVDGEDYEEEILAEAEKTLGVEISKEDYIWQVAQRVRTLNE